MEQYQTLLASVNATISQVIKAKTLLTRAHL